MKNSRVINCIQTFVLLGLFVCRSESQGPEVTITTPPEDTTVCRGSDVTISCGYDSDTPLDPVWVINASNFLQSSLMNISSYQVNNPTTPVNYSLTILSINGTTTVRCIVASQSLMNFTVVTSPPITVTVIGPTPTILTAANVKFSIDAIVIVASWQGPNCTGSNIIMYNITVKDQYSPAIITVPADMSSVVISEFPDNSTRIAANREYNITVSAISDRGASYPSNSVVNSTFILQNCNVTPPSIGTIRVSCDSSHQILVTVTCTNCNNPNMVTSSGSSPLTVGGLDPGIMYSVMINVFDGNQVVLTNQTVERTILVMGNQSGNNGSDNGSGSDSGSGSGSGSDDDDNGSDNDSNSDSDSSGSSAVAIAGGVIGGIVVVIIIVIIIIIMLYYFASYKKKDSTYDDTANLNLKSPTSTGGSHVSAAETNGNTDSNGHSDKVLYAAPAKVVTIPHQTSAGGELYAVSTKAANKTSQAQSTSEHYDEVQDTKTAAQGITYAELQLSTELKGRDPTNHDTAVTYSRIA